MHRTESLPTGDSFEGAPDFVKISRGAGPRAQPAHVALHAPLVILPTSIAPFKCVAGSLERFALSRRHELRLLKTLAEELGRGFVAFAAAPVLASEQFAQAERTTPV